MNTLAINRQSPPVEGVFSLDNINRVPISLPSILIHSTFQGAVIIIVIDPLIYIFYSSFQLLACCSETALV